MRVNRIQLVEAQTFLSRENAASAARTLYANVKELIPKATLSSIDYSIATKEPTAHVANQLANFGYHPFYPKLRMDAKLETAIFMCINNTYPVIVRELRDGWGAKIELLGFHVPDLSVSRVLDKTAELVIRSPVNVETVLAMAAECHLEAEAALDELEGLGFVGTKDEAILANKRRGLEAHVTEHTTLLVDTPWHN